MPGPRILHAVTVPLTVTLMRGQLGHLKRAGFDVTVLSAPGEQLQKAGRDEEVAVSAVSMEREIAPLRDLASLWRLYGVLRGLRPVLVNSGTPKAGLLVGIASWLTGVPCRIHTLRGLRSDTVSGLKRWLLLGAECISCRCAHRVVCNSESLRRRAIALGLTDAQSSLVLAHGSSNGVDAARFARDPARTAELRRSLELPADLPVIGMVGRLTRDKGVPELVQAFDMLRVRFPELRLLLVGDREPGDPLPAAVNERLDRDPHIFCTGWVRDAAPYYQLMTVYCLPTHREGFPNSVLEAHASLLPVVTTTAMGAVDSVEDGTTGLLVPPADASALARALERLLVDCPFAERIAAAGYERAIRDFRQEVVWEALVKLYRELLREKGMSTAAGAAVPAR